MSFSTTTAPWVSKTSQPERPAHARLHLDLPEAPHAISGDVALELAEDGSGEVTFSLVGTSVTIPVAAGETFASVVQRCRAAIVQATYPTCDMPAAE